MEMEGHPAKRKGGNRNEYYRYGRAIACTTKRLGIVGGGLSATSQRANYTLIRDSIFVGGLRFRFGTSKSQYPFRPQDLRRPLALQIERVGRTENPYLLCNQIFWIAWILIPRESFRRWLFLQMLLNSPVFWQCYLNQIPRQFDKLKSRSSHYSRTLAAFLFWLKS